MNFRETIKLIYQKKWLIFWVTVLGAVLFFDLAVIQEPEYKASSKVLVVQKQMEGQNVYTLSRTAQYLTQVLEEGIHSDSFFKEVIKSSNRISEDDFAFETDQRRKQWQKTVKVDVLNDLGVMEIDVFYPQKEKSQEINQAIISVLEKQHQLYHGGGQSNAYLFVHPSEQEGLPITVLEAASFGRPLLLSDIEAHKIILEDLPFFFRSKNTKNLKENLESLLKNPQLAQGRNEDLKIYVKSHYNWDKIVESTVLKYT